MKKLISVLLVLVMCLALACPVLAAEDDFTPSVTYKPAPEFAGEYDTDGCRIIGYVTVDDQVIGKMHHDGQEIYAVVDAVHDDVCGEDHRCLVLTPLSDVDTAPHTPDDARELLKWVYAQLLEKGMSFIDCAELLAKIKAELGADKTVEDLVVRDLFDISVLCEPLGEYLEPEGNVICLDFDLGLTPGDFVVVVTYKNGKWSMIEDVEIQEDGTVTCTTFEHFCPVAILTAETGESDVAPETGVNAYSNMTLWIVVAALAVVALGALVVVQRKRASR